MNTNALKSDHLLEGSLEWLHHQTTEWQMDVEFWREELTFFYQLLRKKELHGSFPGEQLANLEKELLHLSGDSLPELEISLRKHEQALRKLVQEVSSTDVVNYRHDHKTILFSIRQFQKKIRDFKRTVFAFVKK